MNTRSVGAEYEIIAANRLETEGYEIIEKNYHCKFGEIDIVARDGRYTVFVEVKFRRDANAGDPAEAVGYSKIKKISASASYYMMKHHLPDDTPVRFDVVSILGDEIRIYKNAFDYAWR